MNNEQNNVNALELKQAQNRLPSDLSQAYNTICKAIDFRTIETAEQAEQAINTIGFINDMSTLNLCKIAELYYKNQEWCKVFDGQKWQVVKYEQFIKAKFDKAKGTAYEWLKVAKLIDEKGVSIVEKLKGVKVGYTMLVTIVRLIKQGKKETLDEYTAKVEKAINDIDFSKVVNVSSLEKLLKAYNDKQKGIDLTEFSNIEQAETETETKDETETETKDETETETETTKVDTIYKKLCNVSKGYTKELFKKAVEKLFNELNKKD